VSALPVLSGRQLVKILTRLGYEVDRQRGSHIILRHGKPPYRRLVVPDHGPKGRSAPSCATPA